MTQENEERIIKYGLLIAIILVIIFLLSCNNSAETTNTDVKDSIDNERIESYQGNWYIDNELFIKIDINKINKVLTVTDKYSSYNFEYTLKDTLNFWNDTLHFTMFEQDKRATLAKHYKANNNKYLIQEYKLTR
jgi:hypothetical protein